MVSKVLFSSNTGEWGTPPELYEVLNKEFNFTLDPCTTIDNPLGTDWYYTKEMDGLKQNWSGNVYINPPYGSTVTEWLEKGIQQLTNCYVIVYLLPARTDTRWFHKYIYNDESHDWQDWVKQVRFLKGRLKFGGAKNTAPFPSMVVVCSETFLT